VRFPHMRHVNAGVTCQDCHGNVQDMTQVYQAKSLNMGWCVNCHVQRKARYDCSSCHY
jgi:Zn ribbon nucleic-acid-binding protein